MGKSCSLYKASGEYQDTFAGSTVDKIYLYLVFIEVLNREVLLANAYKENT